MPRPLTKGPPIHVRVPLAVHAVLQARADANGETVNQYVARRLALTVTSEQAPSQASPSNAPRRHTRGRS